MKIHVHDFNVEEIAKLMDDLKYGGSWHKLNEEFIYTEIMSPQMFQEACNALDSKLGFSPSNEKRRQYMDIAKETVLEIDYSEKTLRVYIRSKSDDEIKRFIDCVPRSATNIAVEQLILCSNPLTLDCLSKLAPIESLSYNLYRLAKEGRIRFIDNIIVHSETIPKFPYAKPDKKKLSEIAKLSEKEIEKRELLSIDSEAISKILMVKR